MKAERFLNHIMVLGEGPVWDERRQRLYWVDISEGRLWHWDQTSGQSESLPLHKSLGMCALTEDGGLLVTPGRSIELIHGDERRVLVEDAEPDLPGNRFNDGKCDPAGRLLVGSMDTGGQQACGSLYSLERADGQLRPLLHGVTVSNGIGFSPDHRFLYYVDTPSGFLWRFDYELERGELSNRVPLIDYRQEAGSFDGICMDAEGCIWAAHWGGYQVTRWDPRSGRKLLSIPLPAPYVTSCCFGGPGFKTLFITTAWNRDEKARAESPLAGSLFVCDTPYEGLKAETFKP